MTRIYFSGPLAAGDEVRLPPAQSHHLVHVLRLEAGAHLALFNGDGAEYAAVIARIAKNAVYASVQEGHPAARESPLDVTLAQGISRGERMDYTVQKAVELGVARIQPIVTRRAVVRLDAARAAQRAVHWQSVATAACEQCGRNRVPEITAVLTLDDWLAHRRGRGGELGLLLDPEADRGLRDLTRPVGGVILLAGPEGGLTDEERHAARQDGFVAIRLGPRVLRTETAALAALAALQTLWGDF